VRRDVRRHPDGNAGGTVDEEIGERRGQNGGFFGRLVVVWCEVDGLVVEIRHHVVRERLQPRLGISHRRRRVAIDRAVVALAIDQQVAHVEVLRQPDERVVNRLVAVGMEVTHHLANDLGALAVPARRRQPHRLHAVEHAPVCGLESVAGVGQGASDDHAHRVIHVRTLHFVFDVDGVLSESGICHLSCRVRRATCCVRRATCKVLGATCKVLRTTCYGRPHAARCTLHAARRFLLDI
jgi:hypothetical protein